MGRNFPFFNNNSSKNGAFPMETRRFHPIPLRKSEYLIYFATDEKPPLKLPQKIVGAGHFKAAALLDIQLLHGAVFDQH